MEKEDEKKEPKKTVSYWEAYDFKDTNQNSIEVVAISLYVEHFYMSAILEAFLKNDRLSLRDLNEALFNNVPQHLLWEIPANASHAVITKVVKLGYIKALEVPGGLPDFILTQLGLETLQNQTFQSLSATSFFNYQTHLTNKEMRSMNEKMHVLSKRSFIANVIAIVISIISIIVAIAAVVA